MKHRVLLSLIPTIAFTQPSRVACHANPRKQRISHVGLFCSMHEVERPRFARGTGHEQGCPHHCLPDLCCPFAKRTKEPPHSIVAKAHTPPGEAGANARWGHTLQIEEKKEG